MFLFASGIFTKNKKQIPKYICVFTFLCQSLKTYTSGSHGCDCMVDCAISAYHH